VEDAAAKAIEVEIRGRCLRLGEDADRSNRRRIRVRDGSCRIVLRASAPALFPAVGQPVIGSVA
jgi:hypothetical protein